MPANRVISTDSAPAAIGPYSQAIEAPAGAVVFCSGQIALDPVTGEMAAASIESETTQVMKNLSAVLEAAGGTLANVVRTTIYLTDLSDYAAVNEIYAGFFGDAPPARAAVGVAQLPKSARVEIDAIAVIPR